MKVTIDSSESLESAIRVLGAMYDVTLTVATDTATPGAKSRPTGKARSSRASKRSAAAKASEGTEGTEATAAAVATKRSPRSSKSTDKSVSASELRSWARANGYEVGNYGRVPGTVATAYREAHQS
jgi:hypothetical protein